MRLAEMGKMRSLILSIVVSGVLIGIYEGRIVSLEPLSLVYILGSYMLFLVMAVAGVLKTFGSSLLKGVQGLEWLLTPVIATCLSLSLLKFSHVTTYYYSATILFYSLILYHLILLLRGGGPIKFLFSGLLLVALYLMSPTMDKSDPFGPHFQLRVVFWILLIHLVTSWILDQWKTIKQLENERTKAQLRHLKSQIDPHFLFNTLNNLYGLALEKSDETPELIMRLSELMRYSIYKGDQERVPLQSEITYLDNYLSLHQVRLHERGEVRFKHDMDRNDYQIAPLLLIILVENAFKHGLEKLREDAEVEIGLVVQQGRLKFLVTNNVNPKKKATEPGIGLDNLKKRLALIYPERYNFETRSTETNFEADLEIELEVGRNDT